MRRDGLYFIPAGVLLFAAAVTWTVPVSVNTRSKNPVTEEAASPATGIAPETARFSSPEMFVAQAETAREDDSSTAIITAPPPPPLPRLAGIASDQAGGLVWFQTSNEFPLPHRVGDVVSGWQIIEIHATGVELGRGDDRQTLEFFSGP